MERGRYDLNDRRSGVRGPGAGAAGSKATVKVNNSNAARGGRGWSGGCC